MQTSVQTVVANLHSAGKSFRTWDRYYMVNSQRVEVRSKRKRTSKRKKHACEGVDRVIHVIHTHRDCGHLKQYKHLLASSIYGIQSLRNIVS